MVGAGGVEMSDGTGALAAHNSLRGGGEGDVEGSLLLVGDISGVVPCIGVGVSVLL